MTHITALPFSPFIDVSAVDPDRRFVLDECAMFETIRADSDRWPFCDWPVWSVGDDPPPLFIGAPSDEFIDACQRELLPLEQFAGRS